MVGVRAEDLKKERLRPCESMPESIVSVHSALPAYRRQFLAAVEDRFGKRIRFLAGAEQFGIGVVTDESLTESLSIVRNRYLFGRRFLWQSGVIRLANSADVVVLEFNPRILSSLVTLIYRRARRRPTLLWGHVWSRAGIDSRSNRLRLAVLRLGGRVIAYTDEQRDQLVIAEPNLIVSVAHNAIYRASVMAPILEHHERRSVMCSGRLVSAKKLTLALEAFSELSAELRHAMSLIVVGEGPERPLVAHMADVLGISDRVEFVGEEFDVLRLRELYSRCFASLSPGYVGLSIIQSHAFGVPMIYAKNEPHAPEIEAAVEGFNSVAVASDDPEEWARVISRLYSTRNEWAERRNEIIEACRERYSVEAMAEGFASAVETALAGEE